MKTEGASDEALMELYSHGHSQAFAELFLRYERRLRGFLGRRLSASRRHDQEDLFQVVWLKVHQARKQFDTSRKFSSWFFAIAMNSLRDFYRQDEMLQDIDELALPTDDSLDSKFEVRRVEHLLETLTETQRDVILLSDWEGFQAEEISEMLKLKPATVRQVLHRTRKKLKEALSAAG